MRLTGLSPCMTITIEKQSIASFTSQLTVLAVTSGLVSETLVAIKARNYTPHHLKTVSASYLLKGHQTM